MVWTIVITVFVTILVGILLMNFVTSEKEMERKIEHRYAVADPQFRREMSVMMGPSITAGNKIEALQNGDEIFPAMLEAIESAKVSVTFETYIYWSGDIGRKFSKALSDRARAGIPVNMTVDWAGSIKMKDELLEEMRDAGVRIELYRPLSWYSLQRLNNRTHRKLLVVDGTVAFTGGIGVADQWMGNAQDPDHWRDTHFRIQGPVVAQVQSAFNDNWIKMTGEVLNGQAYFPTLTPTGDMDAHMFVSSPAGGSESMHLMYLLAIAAAEESIDLAASYFVPDKLTSDALVAARHRGVKVRVLLPGPHIDSYSVKFASKGEWDPLLMAGAEIHVYQPTMLHTKLLVIDHEFVSVGSTNFDIRSFRLNDEASLNIYDKGFANTMTDAFENDLRSATPYTYQMWKDRPFKERLAETVLLPIKSQL